MKTNLAFHKCRVCGCIFHHSGKTTYCTRCIPSFMGGSRAYSVLNPLTNMKDIERRKAWARARWHRRMSNPIFREKERIRSLNRYKTKKGKLEEKNETTK